MTLRSIVAPSQSLAPCFQDKQWRQFPVRPSLSLFFVEDAAHGPGRQHPEEAPWSGLVSQTDFSLRPLIGTVSQESKSSPSVALAKAGLAAK
jgi:hypothetical protein